LASVVSMVIVVLNAAIAIAASKIERIVGSLVKNKRFVGGRIFECEPIWHLSLVKIDRFQTDVCFGSFAT
jgi:hypothetical protein